MFEQAQENVVIVYRSKETKFAHLLANLITAFAGGEVAEWEEKDWIANKATVASSQKVIFLGDSNTAHEYHSSMVWQYYQHKMKFGWLANQCVVDVDPLLLSEVKSFRAYYAQCAAAPNFAHKLEPLKPSENLPIGLIDRQYHLLIREFVFGGAYTQFMAGEQAKSFSPPAKPQPKEKQLAKAVKGGFDAVAKAAGNVGAAAQKTATDIFSKKKPPKEQ